MAPGLDRLDAAARSADDLDRRHGIVAMAG
jgi:hypothetical protein